MIIMRIIDFKFKDIKTASDLRTLCKEIDVQKKNKIEKVFKDLKPDAYSSSYIYDIISSKQTDIPILGYTIGEYEFDSRVVYYFEHYNLKLRDDFINFVLNVM
jgi:hypothetical protein